MSQTTARTERLFAKKLKIFGDVEPRRASVVAAVHIGQLLTRNYDEPLYEYNSQTC